MRPSHTDSHPNVAGRLLLLWCFCNIQPLEVVPATLVVVFDQFEQRRGVVSGEVKVRPPPRHHLNGRPPVSAGIRGLQAHKVSLLLFPNMSSSHPRTKVTIRWILVGKELNHRTTPMARFSGMLEERRPAGELVSTCQASNACPTLPRLQDIDSFIRRRRKSDARSRP